MQPPTTSSETLKIALDYHAAGLAVLPIQPPVQGDEKTGKSPLVRKWQDRVLSAEDLCQRLKPGHNLGVVCGRKSRLVCLDIDARHGGLRWFFENESELGHFLRESTGDGGFHLYFRYPADTEKVPSCELATGVAMKADGGHQVVTWPSIHWTGKQYAFDHGLTLLDLESEADELPDWLLRLALEKAEKPAPIKQTLDQPTDDPRELERAVENLRHHGPAVEKQHGDVHTFRAACIGLNYGLSPKTWWPHLREWNKTCRPPWDEKELAKKLAGAYRYKSKDLGQSTAAAAFEPVPSEGLPEPEKLTPDQAEAQNKQLGLSEYPYTNAVKSGAKFLSSCLGYRYSEGVHYLYEQNTWFAVPEDCIRSSIRRAVLDSTPDASIQSRHVTEILRHMQDVRYVRDVRFDTWLDERPGDFVRFENGILDLNRLKLLPHSPDWFSCTKLPFSYDPQARCPEFEKFLHSIWGTGSDNIEALQLWFGYVLSRQTSQQKFAMFLGKSRSGKGTILRVLETLVGPENSLALKLSSFRSDFALERAPGKKIVTIADAHSGTADVVGYAAEFILNVSGEDSIPINRKNKSILSLRIPAKVNVAANKMPKFFDAEGSITNRMLLFWFSKSFKGQEDTKLEAKLLAEMPGILNWAIDGYQKFVQRGSLIQSTEGANRVAELSETMNPTETFLREFIEYAPTQPSDRSDPPLLFVDQVYDLYKAWCQSENHLALAKSKLSFEIGSAFAGFPGVGRVRQSSRQTYGHKRTFYTNLRLVTTVEAFKAEEASSAFEPGRADDDEFF